ncbi:MAG: hypothetical protein Ct9H300mP32_1060 [Verrucomicrobiota bacterium]|nr:MAG: hypothetical protein Ct9H300mP32_1060 [Verrucomicrobiota bacterium]
MYDDYEYFFIHYKYTDMYGEDGNFEAKTRAIEDFDKALPILLDKKPDVIAITGDHSTPCRSRDTRGTHSRYWSLSHQRLRQTRPFHRDPPQPGSLGIIEAKHLIRLMQANALMFDKFGA